MAKITKTETLQRTKAMLTREWSLPSDPSSDADLRKKPPGGLGKNDNSIRALKAPIENNDFAAEHAAVAGDDLVAAKTVAKLRDVIWAGIP